MEEKEVGKVTGFFAKISVAAIEITTGELKVGDTIHIKGHSTDLHQSLDSMQIQKQPVSMAKVGDTIGIQVKDRVHIKDTVYKVGD
jgi:putative protease